MNFQIELKVLKDVKLEALDREKDLEEIQKYFKEELNKNKHLIEKLTELYDTNKIEEDLRDWAGKIIKEYQQIKATQDKFERC